MLVVCVLPLAILAALSMGERISQYGWTPERIWGVVAVAIAIVYGAAAWLAVYKGRADFDDPLRPIQTRLAIGLCGLALFLALPIVDFGSISARSQLARLDGSKVTAEEFDWRFPYLVDEDQRIAKDYRAACTPDFFLFDADRRLFYRGQFDSSRPRNDDPITGADLDAAVQALLAGDPPPRNQWPSIGCNIKWKPDNEPDYFA